MLFLYLVIVANSPLCLTSVHTEILAGEYFLRKQESSLSVEIIPVNAIDIGTPFVVSLKNNGETPIEILNPMTKLGFRQLRFQFKASQTEGVFQVEKRKINNIEFWRSKEKGEPSKLTIAAGNELQIVVRFDEFGKVWRGLPDPNIGTLYRVIAIFESDRQLKDQSIWTGSIKSNEITSTIVSQKLKTPFDYLLYGFPSAALELMKQDRDWIFRKDSNSRTPLHLAARFGYTEVVKWLLKNGADVNAIAYNRFTPLHVTKYPSIVSVILESKPDLGIRSAMGSTPVERAALKLLESSNQRDQQNWSEIMELYRKFGAHNSDLLNAVALNTVDEVKRQVVKSTDFATKAKVLRCAVRFGHLEISQYLIEDLSFDPNYVNKRGDRQIIFEAIPHPAIVQMLARNQADLSVRATLSVNKRPYDGSLLHFAAVLGKAKTIELLLDGGLNIFDIARSNMAEEPYTALDLALLYGNAANVSAILNHVEFKKLSDANFDSLVNEAIFTAACQPKIVEDLLERGADPNFAKNGVSVLNRATQAYLLGDREYRSAIKRAMRLLLDYGAELDIFAAVALGDVRLTKKLLLQNQSLANALSNEKVPVLHVAIQLRQEEIVKTIVDSGADLEAVDRSQQVGQTALYDASYFGFPELVLILVDGGADVNRRNRDGQTALHAAAATCSPKCAQLLLQNGARIDVKDNTGDTPLELIGVFDSKKKNETEQVFKIFLSQKDGTDD